MSNLSKLEETIKQLETEADLFKVNNKIITAVTDLSKSIEKSVAELASGNQNFQKTKDDIDTSLGLLNENVKDLAKRNESLVEQLTDANKKFLREFDDTVSSKLSRFSSDIHVTIRQERSQLQEALQTNITTHLNGMESKQKELIAGQTRQINFVKLFLGLTFLINIAILCLIILRTPQH